MDFITTIIACCLVVKAILFLFIMPKIINNLSAFIHLAAIQCLKRKRLYEQQVEQLGNFQLRIHDQVLIDIEDVNDFP